MVQRRKKELTEVEGGQKNGKSEDHGNYVLEMGNYVRFFEYLMQCRFLDQSHIFVYPSPANNLFAGSANSFGFGNDLEKDDIDDCARCNTWHGWFYQKNIGLRLSKTIKKVLRKSPCNIWRGRSI